MEGWYTYTFPHVSPRNSKIPGKTSTLRCAVSEYGLQRGIDKVHLEIECQKFCFAIRGNGALTDCRQGKRKKFRPFE